MHFRGPKRRSVGNENSNLEIDSPLDEAEPDSHVVMEDIAATKPGIFLPKKSEQWNLANDYFQVCVQ